MSIRLKQLAIIGLFAFLLAATVLAPLVSQADEGGNLQYEGFVVSRPSSGDTGVWVIGGETFEANGNTEFYEDHGPLSTGACAEVTYPSASDHTALEIESKEPLECGSDEGEIQIYGTLQSFPPAPHIGEWQIDGVTYTAEAGVELSEEHGPFAIGICVEVKYDPDSLTAVEIETEENYKCNGGGSSSGYSQAYGIVASFPTDLIGPWILTSGDIYTSTLTTQFEQEHGPFFVGGCVEVKYMGSTGTAVEIETTNIDDCSGETEDAEQKFYGFISVLPAGPSYVGSWIIGGLNFTSTVSTIFEQEHGPFAVDVCAEVEYIVDVSGNIAVEIGTEEPHRCSEGSFTSKVYGLVDSLPVSLFGTWVIDGVSYVAATTAKFNTDHGAFVVGACVQVEYFDQDGVNHAVEIETESGDDCAGNGVLPGQSFVYATIDSFPPDPYIGAWTIGALVYTATASTEFEQEYGRTFAIGSCVKAEYITDATELVLTEVEAENPDDCQDETQTEDEFSAYGMVEERPAEPTLTGDWRIGGIVYTADGSTLFEADHGPLVVGAFVEVEYVISDTIHLAVSIETHVAPDAGTTTIAGTLGARDGSDDQNPWPVDGVTYQPTPGIDVSIGGQAPVSGEPVILNSYQLNGVQYVTSASFAEQAFLPIIQR
ncbi:MAG: hypothetical protein GY803_15570 [Chloroflexi bacterium]|nr:hypothetical protein [Chloroflexota bacterium]